MIRIAAMLIVAILSCIVSGIGSMIIDLIAILILFVSQFLICSRYDFQHNSLDDVRNSILSYLPFVILFVLMFIYNFISGRGIVYSVAISLALSLLLLPKPQNYSKIVSYVVNNKSNIFSNGYKSCEEFSKCNTLLLNDECLISSLDAVKCVKTTYSEFSPCEKNDSIVNIIKEFSAILYSDRNDYKVFSDDVKGEYDYKTKPVCKNGITYAVLNNKNGVRFIASGTADKIKELCTEYADKNSIKSFSDDKHELEELFSVSESIKPKTIYFAFGDFDEIPEIDTIKDLILVGAVEFGVEPSNKASSICNEITNTNYTVEIHCKKSTVSAVKDIFNANGLTDYIVTDDEAIIFNDIDGDKHIAFLEENNIIFNGSACRTKAGNFSFNEVVDNANNVVNRSSAIEHNYNIFCLALIITYLLSSVVIPNNIMHPYALVLIGCVFELLSVISVKDSVITKKKCITMIINIFIISICAIGLFLAGRFGVNAPLAKFDAISVNAGRMMLIMFFILVPSFYDSVVILATPAAYLKNIIAMIISIIFVILINLPFVSNMVNCQSISFEGLKYVILFVLIPVLLNAFEVIIDLRKEKRNGR